MDTQHSKLARLRQLLALWYPKQSRPGSIPSRDARDTLTAEMRKKVRRARSSDKPPSDEKLDQYYTHEDIAGFCFQIIRIFFDVTIYRLVEPSAGDGAFFKIFPFGSIAYDLEPKYHGIQKADFLEVILKSDRQIAVIGNPPFGKNASMAVKFFNRSAGQSEIVAMILPRTFRKASIQNRLNRNFHLICDVTLPENAFLFRSKPYNVPAVFQIWKRRDDVKRALWPVDTIHPDFEFTTPSEADFAIQRVGARAGRVHQNFNLSPQSHHFISAKVKNVKATMEKLDFKSVAGNTVGNPSLSKSEIVALYSAYLSRSTITVLPEPK